VPQGAKFRPTLNKASGGFRRNGPESTWEVIQTKRQRTQWEDEMKKHLFSSSDPIYEREVRELDEACNSLGEAMDKMNHIQYGIKEGKKTCQMVEDDYTIDNGPKALGLSHAALYAHSWKPIGPNWVWISKASAVQGIGYPASRNDVHRFGHTARRVRKKGPPPPLSRGLGSADKTIGWKRYHAWFSKGRPDSSYVCSRSPHIQQQNRKY
jgi:hypothetical protein